MVNKELILRELKINSGKKAKDLAVKFNVEKREINRTLYVELKGQCVRDANGCWYLSENAPSSCFKKNETNGKKKKKGNDTRFIKAYKNSKLLPRSKPSTEYRDYFDQDYDAIK